MFKPLPFSQKTSSNQNKKILIEHLYPGLSREEQADAEFFLSRYLEVVRRILERVKRD